MGLGWRIHVTCQATNHHGNVWYYGSFGGESHGWIYSAYPAPGRYM
ncbi:hypothetical protein ACWCP6_28565 [Streptomyces sp. NPDC002004]